MLHGVTVRSPFARGKIANMHADLGDAYSALGLQTEAIREYERALSLCPSFVDIRTKLALVLRDTGRVEEASRVFSEVKQANPRYLPARLHLGVTLYSQGKSAEAAAEWEAVLALDPTNASAKMYLQMVRTGMGNK